MLYKNGRTYHVECATCVIKVGWSRARSVFSRLHRIPTQIQRDYTFKGELGDEDSRIGSLSCRLQVGMVVVVDVGVAGGCAAGRFCLRLA